MIRFKGVARMRQNVLAAIWLVASVAVVSAGCGPTSPASFRLNLVESARQRLEPRQEQQVATILAAMFGTPDDPVALPETGLDVAKLRLAAGPVHSDIVGRKNGLFREHCSHCHGITGDGLGPTAAFLNPYPRDYRPGVFKFKSTERAEKPTHADLTRILNYGIYGTSMPAFELLGETKVDALVEYVKYLAMRGETELALMRYFFELDEEDEGKLPETREFLVEEMLLPIAERWQTAEDAVIPVPEMPEEPDLAESIALGKELFHGTKANCVKCHGVTALGDGQANDYDDWNKVVKQAEDEVAGGFQQAAEADTWSMSAEELAEHRSQIAWLERFGRVLEGEALEPRTIQPRNLRQAIYRGGRRPLDLYYRIHAGINGAPMPAAAGTVSPEEIWHIVNYIRSLPYDFDGELGADRSTVARGGF
jgi:mono/diheme cytochrome c family protein